MNFMGTVLGLFFLALIGGVGYALGLVRGRRHSAAARTAADTNDDARYRAGYLAGHVAGWRDAIAKGMAPSTLPPGDPRTLVHPAAERQRQDPASQAYAAQAAHPVPAHTAPAPLPPSYARLPQPLPMPLPGPQSLPSRSPLPSAPPMPSRPLQGQRPLIPPVVTESPAAAAARKEKRDRQNINITLYVASLLLVAAGALFVGTSLPGMFRFLATWGITVLFYVAGLVLHPRAPRLRPAAIAFTGTGLALIPVTGLAMYNFALHNGPLAWLVTSVLGTAAYVFAAVRLNNQVLAWLSLSFVISTAWSGVSVLGGALVWYFTALIGVAVLLTLLSLLHPRWMPPLYVRPLMVLHPFVVPAVGLAATLTPNFLAKGEYPVVAMMCGAYFGVMALIPGAGYRLQNFYAARAAFTLAVVSMVWDASSDLSHTLLAAIASLGVQSLGMAFAGKRVMPVTWWNDAVACLGLQFIGVMVLTVMLGTGTFSMPEYVPWVIILPTAMAVGWKLGHAAAFAPAAVLVGSLAVASLLGAWILASMFAVAALYWFALAAVVRGPLGPSFVLAGRIALNVAVPAAAAGLLVGYPDRAAHTVLAFVITAGIQQVLGVVLERAGLKVVAPRATAGAFGAATAAGLVVVAFLEHAAGHPAVTAGVLAVLVAGLASGWLAFPWKVPAASTDKEGHTAWNPTVAEALAPFAAAMSLVTAAFVVSRGLVNLVLFATVAYFVATALRLPVSLHRTCYWWLSRATGTFLAVSAYADMSGNGYPIHLLGEDVTAPTVLCWVLAAQLLAVLLAARRGTSLQATAVDAGVLLGGLTVTSLSFNVTTRLSALDLQGGWQPGSAALVTALAAVACSLVLRRHTQGWVFAPAVLALLLLLRLGHIRDVELLLGIFAAYVGFMVAATRQKPARGIYLVALRVLTAAFITTVAADVMDSAAATSVTLALVMFCHVAAHWSVRHWLEDVPFQKAALWATLGVQLVLPYSYLLAGDFDGGGRWVVLLELVLTTAAAVVLYGTLRVTAGLYVAIAGITSMVVAAGPILVFPSGTFLYQAVLDRFQVPVMLLLLAAAVVVARVFLPGILARSGSNGEAAAATGSRWLWFVAATAFAGMAVLAALDSSVALTGVSVLVVALVFFAGSHLESLPSFYAGAAPTALMGAVTAVEGLLEKAAPGPWTDFLPWLLGGMGSGAVLYGFRRLAGTTVTGEAWRRNALAATAALAAIAAAAVGLAHDPTSLTGAVLVVVAAGIVVLELPDGKHLASEIGGLVAVAAFQRALVLVDGARPDWFWLAQWYVVAVAVMAGVRYVRGQRDDGRLRLGIASGLLSLTSLTTIVLGTPSQQVYVLAAHAVLLGAGLLLSERIFVGWGAAGVAASVMWSLRSYAFALLALVAVGLIVLAIWRLNRKPQIAEGPMPGDGKRGGDRAG